ncbi:hypothetical protein [Thermosipho sp. (in: thermotogales)]|jgi:hypothetical protein|uniref:hypothetical protein n=1 Tax=Thermosipho sp. (in: thermotogales) TaxID=1968895 RepID=UPI0025807DE1|nr:hypothetical protein [Thermosipho sp. (in: thermotogales)]MBZ4649230.1 hypothetical protein [Thermosipho sp. (in: thermotogales)]
MIVKVKHIFHFEHYKEIEVPDDLIVDIEDFEQDAAVQDAIDKAREEAEEEFAEFRRENGIDWTKVEVNYEFDNDKYDYCDHCDKLYPKDELTIDDIGLYICKNCKSQE